MSSDSEEESEEIEFATVWHEEVLKPAEDAVYENYADVVTRSSGAERSLEG